ncbi:MAG: TetR/AcrR family transcriptional regulator [Leptospiraceae bacterium]|nr:TetR/AcrR family transcriptional regulator [Leptospiraceae bacterium]MCB1200040.1 TetR/AcrR family transcriptional regulator [Leptospiraceae bacterium]
MVFCNKKDDRADITRKKIFDAARTEFAARGYDGARMNSIAKAAQVNKAMIHYYFNSKEELYQQVLYSLFFGGTLEKNIMQPFMQSELTPPERLYVAIYTIVYIHYEMRDQEHHQIMAWETAGNRHYLKKIARELLVPRMQSLETIIKDGIKSKDFVCKDPIFVLWQLLSFMAFHSMSRETFEDSEVFSDLYEKYSVETMVEILATFTFKIISPMSHKITLPKISKKIINEVKKAIQETVRPEQAETTGAI